LIKKEKFVTSHQKGNESLQKNGGFGVFGSSRSGTFSGMWYLWIPLYDL
jgi:hypothetical protein